MKSKCNCILSGFAQTSNYCPVHKGIDLTEKPRKWWQFWRKK